MIEHSSINDKTLFHLLRTKKILFAGNAKLKIYGSLQCGSGKRMRKGNRLFFESEENAIQNFYRPCGHCMKKEYKQWKEKNS